MMCNAVFAAVLGVAAAQTTGTLQALYEKQVRDNSDLYAAQVMATRKGTTMWTASGSFGQRVLGEDDMRLDSEVRVGSIAELIVVAAALKVDAIRERLTESIDRRYLPNNLALVNPNSPTSRTVPITYEHLMRHTSSLVDPTSYSTEYFTQPTCDLQQGRQTCTGSTTNFRQFMTEVFAQAGANTEELTPQLFSQDTPGTTYRFSHLNTALLCFIMDRMIEEDELVVNSNTKKVGAWIFEAVIQPSGMAGTFYAELNGEIPTRPLEVASAVLQSMMYEYPAGSSNTPITLSHSNSLADVNLFSTPGDLVKLAAQILDNSDDSSACSTADSLCSIGRLMRSPGSGLTDVASTDRPLLVSQGLGVQYFDAVRMCEQLQASTVFNKCPLTSANKVWGYMTGSTPTSATTITGILCTDATGNVATNRASCVAVTQGMRRGSSRSPLSAFAMAAAAYQLSFGETTVTQNQPSDDTDDLYGLWVGFGVCGTIVFVVAASFFTELLIQPTPPLAPSGLRPGHTPSGVPDPYRPSGY